MNDLADSYDTGDMGINIDRAAIENQNEQATLVLLNAELAGRRAKSLPPGFLKHLQMKDPLFYKELMNANAEGSSHSDAALDIVESYLDPFLTEKIEGPILAVFPNAKIEVANGDVNVVLFDYIHLQDLTLRKTGDGPWLIDGDKACAYKNLSEALADAEVIYDAIEKGSNTWNPDSIEEGYKQSPYYVRGYRIAFALEGSLDSYIDPALGIHGDTHAIARRLNGRYQNWISHQQIENAKITRRVAVSSNPHTEAVQEKLALVTLIETNGLPEESSDLFDRIYANVRATSSTERVWAMQRGKFSIAGKKVGEAVEITLRPMDVLNLKEKEAWKDYRGTFLQAFADYPDKRSNANDTMGETVITLPTMPPFLSWDEFKKTEAYDPKTESSLKAGYLWVSRYDGENYAYKTDPDYTAPEEGEERPVILAAGVPEGVSEDVSEKVDHGAESEADFAERLKVKPDDYAKETSEGSALKAAGTGGEIMVTLPTDKTDGDYLNSRIHHFFGKDGSGAFSTVADPTKYVIEVNDKQVCWETTDQYPNGTLFDQTSKRVWVENGTKINWLKSAPEVALVPAEVPPPAVVAAPAEVPAAPVGAPDTAEAVGKARVAVGQIERDSKKLNDLQAERERVASQKIVLSKKQKGARLATLDREISDQSKMLVASIESLKKGWPAFYGENKDLADRYEPLLKKQG